ncbi:MAG TPA: thiamine phosphate synthase [Myxococcota bacterium]
MTNLEAVLALAREAHAGQTRRHGAPYIGHPLAVKTLVDELGPACGIDVDDEVRASALLHDVVEDSEITGDEIGARFGEVVARRVLLVTKTAKGDEATARYYERMIREADDETRLIKVCDRAHNLSELALAPDPSKLAKYVDETRAHLVPLAQAASTPARARALTAVLHDALRAACRAQGRAAPEDIAVPRVHIPAGVYAIVQPHHSVDDLAAHTSALVVAGAAFVQLRAKDVGDREVLAMLEALMPIGRRHGVPIVVNDRADLCVAGGADGVHVGQTDLPPLQVRRVVGGAARVGASSHTMAQLVTAVAEGGADHIAVGPVFASPTKVGHAAVVGVDALRDRARASRLPVVAIGGITDPARAALCADAGAHLVAAVSALSGAAGATMCRRMSLACSAARARVRESTRLTA